MSLWHTDDWFSNCYKTQTVLLYFWVLYRKNISGSMEMAQLTLTFNSASILFLSSTSLLYLSCSSSNLISREKIYICILQNTASEMCDIRKIKEYIKILYQNAYGLVSPELQTFSVAC